MVTSDSKGGASNVANTRVKSQGKTESFTWGDNQSRPFKKRSDMKLEKSKQLPIKGWKAEVSARYTVMETSNIACVILELGLEKHFLLRPER